VIVYAGDAGGASGVGGQFGFYGGAGTGASPGGDFDFQGGVGGPTGAGGPIAIKGGPGGSTSGAGGAIALTAGDAVGSGAGGAVTIDSGFAAGAGQAGGNINVTCGNGTTTGVGGAYNVIAGNGGTTGAGGPVAITAGFGGSTSGLAGAVRITGGAGGAGSAASGGTVNIVGGTGGALSGSGGNVWITGGTPGSGSVTSGSVFISGSSVAIGTIGTTATVNADSFVVSLPSGSLVVKNTMLSGSAKTTTTGLTSSFAFGSDAVANFFDGFQLQVRDADFPAETGTLFSFQGDTGTDSAVCNVGMLAGNIVGSAAGCAVTRNFDNGTEEYASGLQTTISGSVEGIMEMRWSRGTTTGSIESDLLNINSTIVNVVGTSIFGGDLHVSGNLHVSGTLVAAYNNAIQARNFDDTDNYRLIGLGTGFVENTIVVGDNNTVGTHMFIQAGASGMGMLDATGSFILAPDGIGITDSLVLARDIGDDAFFYVGGAIDSRGTATRGTSAFGGDLHVSGNFSVDSGVKYPPKSVTTNYDILNTDHILVVSCSSAITLTLPPTPNPGGMFVIKDAVGNCATHNITLSSSADRIDGISTYTLSTNYSSVTVIHSPNFSTWSII
jgi:hypothetical protein